MAPPFIASELGNLADAADSASQPHQSDMFLAVLKIGHQLPALACAVEIASPGLANELYRLARYLEDRKTANRFEFVDFKSVLKTTAERLHELAGKAGQRDRK